MGISSVGVTITRSSSLFLTFLLMRAILGLTLMNVRDRYISYVWAPVSSASLPALILLIGPAAARLLEGRMGRGWLFAGTLAALALIAGGTWWGSGMILNDTAEAFEVQVAPSKWMAANLPPGAVVGMEPAGAIRTFTDLKLVDNVGLTTNHFRDFLARNAGQRANFADFLRAEHVEYLFDYPVRVVQLLHESQTNYLMLWSPKRPQFTGGTIALLKFRSDVAPPPRRVR